MALGNHTFWVIVDTMHAEAVTLPNDKRAALKFTSEDAARRYKEKHQTDEDCWIVVRVPA